MHHVDLPARYLYFAIHLFYRGVVLEIPKKHIFLKYHEAEHLLEINESNKDFLISSLLNSLPFSVEDGYGPYCVELECFLLPEMKLVGSRIPPNWIFLNIVFKEGSQSSISGVLTSLDFRKDFTLSAGEKTEISIRYDDIIKGRSFFEIFGRIAAITEHDHLVIGTTSYSLDSSLKNIQLLSSQDWSYSKRNANCVHHYPYFRSLRKGLGALFCEGGTCCKFQGSVRRATCF